MPGEASKGSISEARLNEKQQFIPEGSGRCSRYDK
jgi:hypothetical protein